MKLIISRPTNGGESTAMTEFARKTYLVKYYNEDLTFFHSIKYSQFIKNKDERYKQAILGKIFSNY